MKLLFLELRDERKHLIYKSNWFESVIVCSTFALQYLDMCPRHGSDSCTASTRALIPQGFVPNLGGSLCIFFHASKCSKRFNDRNPSDCPAVKLLVLVIPSTESIGGVRSNIASMSTSDGV